MIDEDLNDARDRLLRDLQQPSNVALGLVSGVRRPASRVLTLGLESSPVWLLLAQRGHTVFGWDRSERTIAVARAAALAAGVSDRITFLPLEPAEDAFPDQADFDAVVSDRGLLEVDLERVVRRSKRLLKADGRLLFALHGVAPFLRAAGSLIEQGDLPRASYRLERLLQAQLYRAGLGGREVSFRLPDEHDVIKLLQAYGFVVSIAVAEGPMGLPSRFDVEGIQAPSAIEFSPVVPVAELEELIDAGAPLIVLEALESNEVAGELSSVKIDLLRRKALIKSGQADQLATGEMENDGDRDSLLVAGLVLYEQGAFAAAAEAFSRAGADSSPTTALLEASALLAHGDQGAAEQRLRTATEADPDRLDLWIGCLAAVERHGEVEPLVEAWRRFRRGWQERPTAGAGATGGGHAGVSSGAASRPNDGMPPPLDDPPAELAASTVSVHGDVMTDPPAFRSDSEADVKVRAFPFPYRAMLAIANDIDMSTPLRFREVHRFLNTRDETSMGTGVGLDVADSMWFYHPHAGQGSERETMSYFAGPDWTSRSPFAAEIVEYIRCGWIDSVHAYGNFSAAHSDELKFTRRHAQEALAVMAEHELALKVWVNHGNENNRQNVGDAHYMQGDHLGSPAYHWDLTSGAGVRFVWIGGDPFVYGHRTNLEPLPLRDDSKALRFGRFHVSSYEDALADGVGTGMISEASFRGMDNLVMWHPRLLHAQLSERRLDTLIANGHFAVVAQHFGHSNPLLGFGVQAISALRRLASYQERGDILVARTERLLEYNRVRDHIRFAVERKDGHVIIDLQAIDDPAFGSVEPELENVRGLTFEISAAQSAELRLRGAPVPAELILETELGRDGRAIGVRWFEPDDADHSAEFEASAGAHAVPFRGDGLASLQERVASFLDTQAAEPVPGVTDAAYEYALGYTKRQYARGLEDFAARMRKLGFGAYGSGLDVGSGPGQWSLVFAHERGAVQGVDSHAEFVELANRVAKHVGLADRARFSVARAESLPFDDASFPLVWSHSVLQLISDTEVAIAEISRVLRPMGQFYCGYSSFGFRVEAIRSALVAGDAALARRQVGSLLAQQLYDRGLQRNGWSMMRSFSMDQLLSMCAVFGFTLLDEPGVQGGESWVLGHRGTFDFVLRRDRGRHELTDELAGQELGPSLLAVLKDLVEVGCPRCAVTVLEAHGEEVFEEPGWRDLFLRALVKANLIDDGRADRLDDQGVEPITRGLLRHQRRQYEAALSCYSAADDSESAKALLGAAALLALDRDQDAEAWLSQSHQDPASQLALGIARLELVARHDDVDELIDAFAAFSEDVATRAGAPEASRAFVASLR